MPSTNLEQGVVAIQQQDMATGKRLLKIALKNDSLTAPERVQALLWLAETDPDPQFKVDKYQQAIQIDPTNQDVMNRLSYWTQQLNQQQGGTNMRSTSTQGMPAANPNQGQNWSQQQNPQQNPQQFNQGFTPSQGMNPVNPNQGQNWSQQQNQQQNQQQFNQGFTPSQGMNPVNPNQGQNWSQQQNQQQNPQGFTPSQGMPPANTPQFQTQSASQQPTVHLSSVQRTVGITGGPHGLGTGFFVTRDGLIATTRNVAGGERKLTIELLDRRRIQGDVVRAFPELDLVLIQSTATVDHLLGVSQAPVIPDDMPIVAVTHSGEGMRSTKRRTMNQLASHWFPTLINLLRDAGGNPIFDANNLLVGMLTNNKQRSNGYYYGLHIDKVYQCVNVYIHEKGQLEGQNTIYCASCGIISRAPSFSGYFCENCGNTHPYALEMQRFPQPALSALYGENSPRACPNCGSNAGFYDRDCLRCGYQL